MTLRIAPLLLVLALAAGCAEPVDETPAADQVVTVDYTPYGEPPALDDGTSALTPAALTADPAAYDGEVVRVEGTVAEVCQMAGCWLTLHDTAAEPGAAADEAELTVRVLVPKDADGTYVYTFPTDLGALDVIVEGTVEVDTMSVDELRHFAEDEGRPQAEIDAITEPRPTVVLTARGALVEVAGADAEPAAQL